MEGALIAGRHAWLSTHLGPAGPRGTRLTSAYLHPIGAALIADTRWAEDLHRVQEAPQLVRLDGIGQVFVGSGQGYCSRAAHSREVSDIAATLAGELGLRQELAAAIGLAHDCGHPPLSHVGEAVIRAYWPEFHHSAYAAEVALVSLGLSPETLAGVRRHPWSAHSSGSAEAEVVRWADRIAYLTRDHADAVTLGMVDEAALPREIEAEIGTTYVEQREALLRGVVQASLRTGSVCSEDSTALAMARLRQYNFDTFYTAPAVQSQAVVFAAAMVRALHRVAAAFGIKRSPADAGPRLIHDLMTMNDAALLAYADESIVPFALAGQVA
ncbi:HD domain-containing protein [Kribbella sp. NPDC003557]|uniref:HD domain-containing protein n=1 Tax=Kribbella sp. NPDC003557 TaxID=3154449 RepID=UPI0033A3F5C3